MKLYNSLSEKVEDFQALQNTVSIYVCGITPYDTTHLGHAFTYTSMDILIRFLEMRGIRVQYVQNVTDIDDDILRKAREGGENWLSLGNRWTAHFIHDLESLNVRPPDNYVRATDVIGDIIISVQSLLDKGVAYASDGSVYYSVDSWPEFGKLSHLPRQEMLPIANERGNHPDDKRKHDPLDFVLWQAQSPGEPAWDSPWGPGRPGWHIECSTMSTKYLGKTIDIHGGGADLCFPHHECEIAQVEPVTNHPPFVRYWLHTAMVRYQGEKMSKSLGNLIMVRDLLKTYSPDALRIYLGSHQYRQTWSYSEDDLAKSAELAEKLRLAVTVVGGRGATLSTENFGSAINDPLENDLFTPGAIQGMNDLAEAILVASSQGGDVHEAQQILRRFGRVFGLRLDASEPEKSVQEGWDRIMRAFQIG